VSVTGLSGAISECGASARFWRATHKDCFLESLTHNLPWIFVSAFTRSLLAVLEVTDTEDKISLICDDEEEAAWPMYQLFRKVKIMYPDAHEKLRSITFADDRWSFGLQAADLVVSLTRQEAAKRFFGTDYQYGPLFSALSNTVPKDGDTFWLHQFGFCDTSMLKKLGDRWAKTKPHSLEEAKSTFRSREE
jgi:hypothetical protein